MSLTDEQVLTFAARHLGEMHIENCGLGDIKDFARAIESAACAERDKRIAELEADRDSWVQQASDRTSDAVAFAQKAERFERECVSLRNTLEAVRKDAERLDYFLRHAGFGIRKNGVIELSICFSGYQPSHIGQLKTAIDAAKEQG